MLFSKLFLLKLIVQSRRVLTAIPYGYDNHLVILHTIDDLIMRMCDDGAVCERQICIT